jgi:hypothetical protein
MRTTRKATTIVIALFAVCVICFPQTDPKNVPQPPTAELKKFDPFLGKYQVSGEFANLPWTGTLELKRVIKGWYIEQIILVKTEGIDREFRILATWDKNVQKYRLWGFQTLPIMPDNGGEIRFEGDEMITEWVSVRPDGSRVTSSNRYRFVSKDELEIVSFRQVGTEAAEKIGFLKGKQLNADGSAANTSDQPPANSPQPAPEMQTLARILSGAWSGTLKVEPTSELPSGGTGEVSEVWRASPGGMPLVEENHIRTTSGESYDYAAVWWNGKAQKYQGIWCADINDEGCNGFEAKLERNQLVMTGDWEKKGKRRAWREVFAQTSTTSVTQSLEIGEPGAELKRVSAIDATKVMEAPMIDVPAAESELRAMMEECRQASLQGDTERIANCLADEYRQTDISGYVQDKTTWLNEYFKPLAELIKAAKFRWEIYARKDMQFQMYRDCAVVMGALELKGSGARPTPEHTWVPDPNASFSGTLRFTHVYIKRNGKWLLAALHNQLPLQPMQIKN